MYLYTYTCEGNSANIDNILYVNLKRKERKLAVSLLSCKSSCWNLSLLPSNLVYMNMIYILKNNNTIQINKKLLFYSNLYTIYLILKIFFFLPFLLNFYFSSSFPSPKGPPKTVLGSLNKSKLTLSIHIDK